VQRCQIEAPRVDDLAFGVRDREALPVGAVAHQDQTALTKLYDRPTDRALAHAGLLLDLPVRRPTEQTMRELLLAKANREALDQLTFAAVERERTHGVAHGL
jgi:hypothetical protein